MFARIVVSYLSRSFGGSFISVLPRYKVPTGYDLQPAPFELQPLGAQNLKAGGVFECTSHYDSKQTTGTMFVAEDSSVRMPSPAVAS